MKRLIKTCLVEHKRIVSLTKSTICTAVILSLAFTANLSAVPIYTLVTLTGDTVAGGSNLLSEPLVTTAGNITFEGTFTVTSLMTDPDLNVIGGADGNTFDLYGPAEPWARLTFDFDVYSLSNFVYGGNLGNISIEAYDVHGNIVASFDQASTYDGEDIGPITLTTSGAAIRSLYWTDTDKIYTGYAALDNITVIIPEAATILLLALGGLTLLKRR